MISRSFPFLAVALASVALAQTPVAVEKTFHFTYVDTPQQTQEIVNAMRAIVDVKQASVDNAARTMTLGGTADQIAMAAWILPQVDLPASTQSAPPQNPPALDYRLAGSSDAVAHVFYLSPANTPQTTQEVLNSIRSVFEVQRITALSSNRALVMRGTADQVAGTSWMINALDRPAGSPAPNPSYTFTADPNNARIAPYNAVRIFYPQTPNPQATQEIVNSVRSITELQRVVAYNRLGAIVARGTPDQINMAEWLINALGKPAAATSQSPAQAVDQYPMAGSTDVARVFYLPPASPESLQEAVAQVRSTTRMQRVTSYSVSQAMVVRGSVGQVEMAAKLIQER
jgi:type II secretory pathway component GspD/PulD (secretin)